MGVSHAIGADCRRAVRSLLWRRRFADARAFMGGAILVGLASGLLDWVTWGRPFGSTIAYMEFTLQGGSSTFGVFPASYYLQTTAAATGLMLPVVLVGLLGAFRVAPVALLAAASFVLAHCLIPHKEYRFLSPIMPLALSLAAAGLADSAARIRVPAWALGALGVLCAVGSAFKVRTLTNGDLGHYLGRPYAGDSVWHFQEAPTLLLAEAGQRADLCGVLTLGLRAGFTGGFSYLHRNVPLLYRHQACDATSTANYIIAAPQSEVPRDYSLVDARDGYRLLRRAGACAPPPAGYDEMLEGADDMGLYRAPIVQPDRSELNIAAGSSAAAFVSGFSHGEKLECRDVRWAMGKSSRVVFPLEPTGGAYSFTFSAQPYFRALPQTTKVSLNGKPLADFSMSEGWGGYQAAVRSDRLRQGQNTLDFSFRTRRAPRGTTRVSSLCSSIAFRSCR